MDLIQFLVSDKARVFRRSRLDLDRLFFSTLQLSELLGWVFWEHDLATLVDVAQNKLKLVRVDDWTE